MESDKSLNEYEERARVSWNTHKDWEREKTERTCTNFLFTFVLLFSACVYLPLHSFHTYVLHERQAMENQISRIKWTCVFALISPACETHRKNSKWPQIFHFITQTPNIYIYMCKIRYEKKKKLHIEKQQQKRKQIERKTHKQYCYVYFFRDQIGSSAAVYEI